MGGIDEALADAFQIRGVPKARDRLAIEDLKDFRVAGSNPQQKHPFGTAEPKNR
jgi:hypothetical protein